MMLEGAGLKGGLDIMAGPPGETSLNLPPLDEMTPERIAALGGKAVVEEESEEEEELDGKAGEGAYTWDEDEWDEGLAAMGGADPLGDVGWDVAERFDVLIAELLTTPAHDQDMLHAVGQSGGVGFGVVGGRLVLFLRGGGSRCLLADPCLAFRTTHRTASQYHNVFLSRHFLPLMRAKMEDLVALGPESEEGAALQAVLLRLVKYAEQLVVQLQEVSRRGWGMDGWGVCVCVCVCVCAVVMVGWGGWWWWWCVCGGCVVMGWGGLVGGVGRYGAYT